MAGDQNWSNAAGVAGRRVRNANPAASRATATQPATIESGIQRGRRRTDFAARGTRTGPPAGTTVADGSPSRSGRLGWSGREIGPGRTSIADSELETNAIVPRGNLDPDPGLNGTGTEVILREALAHLCGASADDGVVGRVVIRLPSKNFGADDALPQQFIAAGQALVDEVGEQLLALCAGAERGTAQHFMQRQPNEADPISTARLMDGQVRVQILLQLDIPILTSVAITHGRYSTSPLIL
jgi:hypothetical protein